MFKRIFTLLFCLFLILNCSTFTVFANGDSPDGVPVGYSPAGMSDQVDAFRAYCKSRNLFVEGSALDTITDVTTTIYQHLVADAGLDINELQNQIYKNTSGNVGAQWFFTQTGIAAYNRLFAELLQNNDLAVGDQVANKNIYSGEQFVDDDGNKCLIYDFNITSNVTSSSEPKSNILKYGSYLKYDANTLNSLLGLNEIYNAEFHIYGRTYAGNLSVVGRSSNGLGWSKFTSSFNSESNITIISPYDSYWAISSSNTALYGGCIVYRLNGGSRLYIGTFCDGLRSSKYESDYFRVRGVEINTVPPSGTDTSTSITQQNVYYTTNNETINNNNYEGDTYITNEGDIVNNNPSDPGGNTPGGSDPGWNVGGGQGSYEDNNGNSYTINFPDFELPDLNIDWSIDGLGNKFPFSIPFDIAALVGVLNAEPEAPRFQGTVDFGFTTWNYDINLAQFDSVAQVCRIAELLLLVFGLILITRSLIKG